VHSHKTQKKKEKRKNVVSACNCWHILCHCSDFPILIAAFLCGENKVHSCHNWDRKAISNEFLRAQIEFYSSWSFPALKYNWHDCDLYLIMDVGEFGASSSFKHETYFPFANLQEIIHNAEFAASLLVNEISQMQHLENFN
jgi:hypothetical protein